MRKLIQKVIPFALLGFTLFSHLADPIKQYFVSRYDLRFYETQDTAKRTETIAIHNAGGSASPRLMIEFDIQSASAAGIADIDFGHFAGGPKTSLLHVIAHTDSLTRLLSADGKRLMSNLDEHSEVASLYDLDDGLKKMLGAELQGTRSSAKAITGFLNRNGQHQKELRKCKDSIKATAECGMERAVERWEYLVDAVLSEASNEWRRRTDVELKFPGRDALSPKASLGLSFSVNAEESGIFTIHYGPSQIQSKTMISPAVKHIIRVDDEADLEDSYFWLSSKYDPLAFWSLVVVLCIVVYASWPLLQPIESLPTFEIFNLALKTNEANHWTIAFQRTGAYIFEEFRNYCEVFGKPNLAISSEELFDYVKDFLRADFARYGLEFGDDSHVNRLIRLSVRRLVAGA